MQDKSSFFDLEDLNPLLLSKPVDLQPPDHSSVLAASPFHVKQKNGKIKLRHLILTPKFLFLAKGPEKKLCKVMDFHLVRFRLVNNSKLIATLNKSIKNPVLFNYSFLFLKFDDEFEVLTNDLKLFKLWKKMLVPLLIQHTFHEDYSVLKMIGKGSFAKVYLAQNKETMQYFAVKAFNKEFLTKNANKGKAALINEISITRQLEHPNIIKIHEVYETAHSIYLVMDLITGGDLLQKLSKNEKYLMNDIKRIMRTFLEILVYIHSKGIMHRDLKPENILLRSENDDFDIIIADFGLATTIQNSKILFHHCGTPGFIAPEVLNYSKATPFYTENCDIYSAGIIFYILLTGKKPFYSKVLKELIEMNRTSEIDFNAPELMIQPLETVDLLKRMLNPNPKLRLSAAECLQHSFFAPSNEDHFTFSNSEWENYMERQMEMLSSDGNYKSIYFSNQSPLVSRHPGINGRTSTVDSSDISPNVTQHKIEADSNSSMKLPAEFPHLIALFSPNQTKNRRFDNIASPSKKLLTQQTRMMHFFEGNEQEFWGDLTNRGRKIKKFTCLPKLISPIACDEVEEEEKKGVD